MKVHKLFFVAILFLFAFVSLALESCATTENVTGNPIDETAVRKIIDGSTTQEQIISWFGAPTTTSELGGNVLYVFKYCKTSGSGFYTGYFGQTKTKENCNELTVTFDKNTGTVKAHNYKKAF
jgi:outer membrane protein assembly factor BamE (lipoprotein component of BamABCDE complex)